MKSLLELHIFLFDIWKQEKQFIFKDFWIVTFSELSVADITALDERTSNV